MTQLPDQIWGSEECGQHLLQLSRIIVTEMNPGVPILTDYFLVNSWPRNYCTLSTAQQTIRRAGLVFKLKLKRRRWKLCVYC
eukprot:scaffold1956_cov173-Skeletonema_marinoi.AAC.2